MKKLVKPGKHSMTLDVTSNIILTLDVGGTNFVFSALQHGKFITDTVCLPASIQTEDSCTATIIDGFEILKNIIKKPISALSFSFPGPADYSNGIIGNLPNFPGINGNYPLKFILEAHFDCPCFINNDGNLFAFGEALKGALQEVNLGLKVNRIPKIFSNLIGITLGTGIGCGFVINQNLFTGDNSSSAEIHNMSNLNNSNWNIEESVSTRAIQRIYSEKANIELDPNIMPEDIYDIALRGSGENKEAALYSFIQYGKALGFVLADVITLIDGLVVIGGGISAAWDLFAPAMFKAIHKKHRSANGNTCNRTTVKVFNLENEQEKQIFFKGTVEKIKVFANNSIYCDTMARTAVMRSKRKASNSISIGAYYFAISQLNNHKNN